MTNITKKISQGTAITSINPNAKYNIYNDDLDNMEWLDGTTSISKEDIEAKISELETAETDKETAKATAKASGNTKLLALGLTQAEATALTGYTPE